MINNKKDYLMALNTINSNIGDEKYDDLKKDVNEYERKNFKISGDITPNVPPIEVIKINIFTVGFNRIKYWVKSFNRDQKL